MVALLASLLLLAAPPDPLESMKERLATALPSKAEEIRALKLKEPARACFAFEVVAWMAHPPPGTRLRRESLHTALGDGDLVVGMQPRLEIREPGRRGPICDPSGPCDTCGRPVPAFCKKMLGEDPAPPPPPPTPCPTLGLRYLLEAMDGATPAERAEDYEAAEQVALGQASNAIAAGECRLTAANITTAPRLLERLRALESNPRACREGP